MLNKNDIAPDFELPDQSAKLRSLKSFLQNGPLILYFYPADFTSICTKQACMYRDMRDDLTESGLQVVGVSAQSVESHQRFAEHYQLNFPILSDLQKSCMQAYGALTFGKIPRRVSYFINTDATILEIERSDLRLSRHRNFTKKVQSYFDLKSKFAPLPR